MTSQDTPSVQPVSEMHARLLAVRKQTIAEHEQLVAAHREKLADIDAAIAAIVMRQPPPVAPAYEPQQCGECGGWLVARDGIIVHERDGGIACKPGHSGPVARPLDQTQQFPEVPPGDQTEVIPVVAHPNHPYAEFVGRKVRVALDDGGEHTGRFVLDDSGQSFCVGRQSFRLITAIRHIKTAEPADLDQVAANPAARPEEA